MKNGPVLRPRSSFVLLGLFCTLFAPALGLFGQEKPGHILLVYGSGKFKQGDNRVSGRLLKSGYTVTAISDAAVSAEDSLGKDLVILSDSVSDARLGDMFRFVPTPVLCSEAYQLDNLGMTALHQGADYGQAQARQAMTIRDTTHTLAAGLAGSVLVSNAPFPMGWGVPGENAQIIATLGRTAAAEAGSQPRYAYFAYESGAGMPNLVAPAMRIAFFLSSKTWTNATPEGLKLFDAAVEHGVRATTGGCIPCQTGEHQVTLSNKSAETVWVGVFDTVKNRGVAPSATCFKDWELAPNASKTYCAPYGANFRFFPRGGCKDPHGAWKDVCDTNDCNSPPPAQATCDNGGLQSLAEINFDNYPVYKYGAYYDVSYVDGYTNAVTVTVDNVPGCTTLKAGCETSLGPCPWPTRDSMGNLGGTICWGASKEIWARYYKDNLPESQRPTLAQITAVQCQCPAPYGCGDADCNDTGCGCSPHSAYPASYSARTCCSPIPDLEAPYLTPCAPDHCTWPDPYPTYARQVKTRCDASYSWQFHDSAGLMHCTSGTQPYAFTVTFWPK